MSNKVYSDIVKVSEAPFNPITEAVNFSTDITCSTMGAKGKLVMVQNEHGYPKLTKDGVSVLKTLAHKDRHVDQVLQTVKESSLATAAKCGDGTSSTVALLSGLWSNQQHRDHREVRKDVDDTIDWVNKHSKSVEDTQTIYNIAKVSGNGDEVIANTIREAYDTTGDIENTILQIDTNPSSETEIKVDTGYKLEDGFLSRHYANTSKNDCVYDSAKLLLINSQNLRNLSLFSKVNEVTGNVDVPLVIVCHGLKDEFLEKLSGVYLSNKKPLCIIRIGTDGTQKDDVFNDLGKALGVDVVTDGNFNQRLKGDPNKVLADIKNFKSNASETIFTPVEIKEEALQYLRDEINQETNIEIKAILERRLAKFLAKVATIRIAGDILAERSELIDRLEDSVFAVRTAVRGGYVAGAGNALASYSSQLELEGRQSAFSDAISMPMKIIYSNAGLSPKYFQDQGCNPFEYNQGADLYTGELCNLEEEGIIDPTNAVVTALENAFSIFKLFSQLSYISVYEEASKNA